MKTNTIPRDGALTSPWQTETNKLPLAQPDPQTVFDCLIVGGGITGLTTGLLLQQAGKKTGYNRSAQLRVRFNGWN